MQRAIEVHWLYHGPAEMVNQLVDNQSIESICIDKRPEVEAVLRLTLFQKNITPSESLKIHAWALYNPDKIHFFFLNDQQNNLLVARHQPACNQ